ncbi:MAG: ugp [Chloroflexi bacterium]|jgi:UTP--glucose-1-phosphate uridylyltransferase|nr:ugp [Chloroflexota bacterium]
MADLQTTFSNEELEKRFAPFDRQMRDEGVEPIAIDTFKYYFSQLLEGNTGLLGENELVPLEGLPDIEKLEGYQATGREALARAVIIKLNGGLGTSMGLDKAKSLLTVKNGLSFLDIIARQVLNLRRDSGYKVPLIFMNSFNTHEDTLEALAAYPDLDSGTGLAFIQNKVPKVLQADFQPVQDAPTPDLAWCPPGHGDIYTSLQTSQMLDKLLDGGYEYAFVSNADNLGAIMDDKILGYFAASKLPFLMEVADRTQADSKGGHLARRKDGRLVLREVAQCPPEDLPAFGDITRYTYFNTNSIWLHLPSLRETLNRNNNVLKLPLIRNSKTLDPRNPESPRVYQMETAMGAAIEIFEGAGALRVPRTRFAPVKLTSDLLVLWSDAYLLTPESKIVINPENRYYLPIVQLDSRYYKFIQDLQKRFPEGAPSLTNCEKFQVEGDVLFGRDIVAREQVKLSNPGVSQVKVEDGAILEGDVNLS